MENKKYMGIIKNVGFGNRDIGRPVLFFNVYSSENIASLQILELEEAVKFIKEYGVYDVKELEGKPVWMVREGAINKVSRPCLI